MKFLDLAKYQKKINLEIEDYFDKQIKEAAAISPYCKKLTKDLKFFVLAGGKRLRGFLVILGYRAFGGRNEKNILKVAAAAEIGHSAILIHDDLIDQDAIRRGGLTFHKKYQKWFESQHMGKEAEHLGNSFAIVSGGILATFMNKLIAETNFKDEYKERAMSYLSQKGWQTGIGEILDIYFSGRLDVKEKDILNMQRLKTATYTVESPLFIGGLLAGVELARLMPLKKYALLVGEAFQIKDDLLDLYGSKKAVGKSLYSDLKEGKQTLIFKRVYQKLKGKDRDYFSYCFGRKNINTKEVEKIKKMIQESSVKKETKEILRKKIKEAKLLIGRFSFISFSYKQILKNLADFVIEREK